MKKLLALLGLVFILVGFSVRKPALSSIYGNIEPPEAAKMVWAISGKDSLMVAPETGRFSIAVTPGKWTIYVQAVSPYKDIVIENLLVSESRSTNAGVIQMSK